MRTFWIGGLVRATLGFCSHAPAATRQKRRAATCKQTNTGERVAADTHSFYNRAPRGCPSPCGTRHSTASAQSWRLQPSSVRLGVRARKILRSVSRKFARDCQAKGVG